MRRKDREITNLEDIIDIMRRCDVCCVAIHDEPYPYIVPLNFGMEVNGQEIALYFHCANEGTKLDLIRKNNHVTFEMDCGHDFYLDEDRMSCTMGYESVIGHGEVEFVKDEEKLDALRIIMNQYHAQDFPFGTELLPVTTVLKLRVADLTGKRRVTRRK